MKSIRALTAAALGAGLLLVTACGSSSNPTSKAPAGGGSSAPADTIVVGSANFQENVVLADIYAGALKAKGVKVTTKLTSAAERPMFRRSRTVPST